MEKNPTWIPVVAGALQDDRGRFLLRKRPVGKPHAGLWEFPGGKVESQENPRVALCRELYEELGIVVETRDLQGAGFADENGNNAVVLWLYNVLKWENDPQDREGGGLGWFYPKDAGELALSPLDRQLLVQITG